MFDSFDFASLRSCDFQGNARAHTVLREVDVVAVVDVDGAVDVDEPRDVGVVTGRRTSPVPSIV